MKTITQKLLPHCLFFSLFVAISVLFFHPVLQGKKIVQSDIVQYNAMAKERNDFRETRESYWTNSAFGGMPTYQLGANYENDFIKQIDKAVRFLPRPADYLFLYFINFYLLLLVLGVRPSYSFAGALAFGFSTYLIIILSVGHNAKAHAIGYFPLVLAGFFALLQRRFLFGFLLSTLGLGLQISANHYQMSYYLLLLMLVIGGVKLIEAFREKQVPNFAKSVSVFAIAAVFGVLFNATNLLATSEYAQFSTRGKSELTLTPEGLPKASSDGLTKEYITEYSYGIAESLNLIVPNLFGGGSSERLNEKSHSYQFLTARNVSPHQALGFVQHLPTYWGNQPIVAAPAYVGIVVFFLFVLAIFLVKTTAKRWLVGAVVLSLLLSWGKNLEPLTSLLIEYFPLYNKFRAVSSIQVILELCMPILAILGLYQFSKNQPHENKKPLLYTSAIVFGVILLLFVGKSFASFEGIRDGLLVQTYGEDLLNAIIADRKSLYTADLLRSFLFSLATLGVLVAFSLRKISAKVLPVCFALLFSLDMIGVASRYISVENFTTEKAFARPFVLSASEKEIANDPETFRVLATDELLNGARTSYFFHSLGGYHAAKPQAMQELFEYQIYKGNVQILNMLNVKYLTSPDRNSGRQVQKNTEALGNAWFVKNVFTQPNADKVMQVLDTLSVGQAAVWQPSSSGQTPPQRASYNVNEQSSIKLVAYQPDKLIYQSNNTEQGFAVFSEIYYPHGWKAEIDGQQVPIYRVNYVLRGLEIPSGEHQIVFTFSPQVVQTGQQIVLWAGVLFLVFVVGFVAIPKIFQRKW